MCRINSLWPTNLFFWFPNKSNIFVKPKKFLKPQNDKFQTTITHKKPYCFQNSISIIFIFIYFQFSSVSKVLRRVTSIENEVKDFIFVKFYLFLYIFHKRLRTKIWAFVQNIFLLFAESWFVFWPQLQNDY